MHVILIDAKNAVYRFGWAHRHLQSEGGVHTGAIYGLLNCLLRLKLRYPDSRFVMVWDGEGGCWRSNVFPGYKANRSKEKSPEIEGILAQIPLVKLITKHLGVSTIEIKYIEADDLIGMLAFKAVHWGWKPVIYSSDKDFLQLVHQGVTVIADSATKVDKLSPETNKTVSKRFGCPADQVLTYRALIGDPSDGIPNVKKGMGPKAALKLMAQVAGEETIILDNATMNTFRRNLRIMQIVTDHHSTELGVSPKAIWKELRSIKSELTIGPTRSKSDFRDFCTLLGTLGMVDALTTRHELWRLQRPQASS